MTTKRHCLIACYTMPKAHIGLRRGRFTLIGRDMTGVRNATLSVH